MIKAHDLISKATYMTLKAKELIPIDSKYQGLDLKAKDPRLDPQGKRPYLQSHRLDPQGEGLDPKAKDLPFKAKDPISQARDLNSRHRT